jgi:hypothetical protein
VHSILTVLNPEKLVWIDRGPRDGEVPPARDAQAASE